MSTQLILKQTLPSGQTRTWRLRPAQDTLSYGASRLADLISIDPHTAGIEAIFQYQNKKWVCISMKESTAQFDSTSIQTLSGDGKVQVGNGQLTYSTIEREENLLSHLETRHYEMGQDEHRLVIAKRGQRIVYTLVLSPGEKIPEYIQSAGLELIEKPVKLEDLKNISEQKMSDYVQQVGKKETGIIFGFSLLIALAIFLGPKTEPIQVAMPPPQVVTKITLKKDIEKQQKEKKAAQAQQQQEVTKQAQQGNPTKTAVTNTFVGGRLTQLLGKVSSQAAKSKNVFVANGKKADEGSSARALAAVGNINRAGTDWGSQGKSGPGSVSTAGQAGGRGNSGLSGLSQGKIGAAGVGLLEEESEVSGGLDPEIIAQYIKSQLGQILYCYERQLSANPDLFGKVAVKFTIGPNGQVEARNINNSTLKNTNVEGCILSKIAGWKFPAPQGGTRVLVTYPFLFKSTN